ncbi:MAG: hypothetical protein Q3988_05285 [Gemella sp.]|nr:hypothetical protein [Gemella sp.]
MIDKIESFFSGLYHIGVSLISGGLNAVFLYFSGNTLVNTVIPELLKPHLKEVDFNLNVFFAIVLTLVSLWLIRNVICAFIVIYLVIRGEI